ncbi:MAG: Holliday junction resolvase RuvX [Gammaproteobacteria bacterium]
MIVLGFDVGRKKTGVAIGNLASRLARPLTTARGGRQEQLREVGKQIAKWQPHRLIVGMPLYADGTAHKMSKTARVFGDALAVAFALPVSFVDERFSTVAARAAGLDADTDAVAAGIILQDWLDGGDIG